MALESGPGDTVKEKRLQSNHRLQPYYVGTHGKPG
jgi:hypothetical protein